MGSDSLSFQNGFSTKTSQPKSKILRSLSPGPIMAITIGGIALAEVIAMIIVYFFHGSPYLFQVIIDTTVLTIIVLPLLYFLSYKPILQEVQQLYQADRILQSRMRLMEYATTHSLDELLQTTVDEIESLSGSRIGFFHFLESDQKTLWLQAWSTNTLQHMCKAEGKDKHYDMEAAGVWADCVRLRRPVIHNDYASLANRKGLPEGHAAVVREMAIPIMRKEKIVAIFGIGNKPEDYTSEDMDIVTQLADFAWDVVEHKRVENALFQSEEKFRTLVDWTYDWETWLDPEGKIVYISPSCERITGYSPREFVADPALLVHIVHPDDRQLYIEHQKIVHDVSADPMMVEYRIIHRNGDEHWIEHVCRPLFSADGRYLGRRISNRDITERKRTETKIIEFNHKEKLLNQTIHNLQMDIARDLHDTLGQNISFLRMNLEYLSESEGIRQTDLDTQIQTMTRAANESYDLIRAMLAVLQVEHSADPLILFKRYGEQIEERSSFQVDIIHLGIPRTLSPTQNRQLFFIFREALSNIEKHADSTCVTCTMDWGEHSLTLSITDDGLGFDPELIQSGSHYGLKFMRQRIELLSGSFSIQSTPGKGSTITVQIPYEEEFFALP